VNWASSAKKHGGTTAIAKPSAPDRRVGMCSGIHPVPLLWHRLIVIVIAGDMSFEIKIDFNRRTSGPQSILTSSKLVHVVRILAQFYRRERNGAP
jgi:hypothetical protein